LFPANLGPANLRGFLGLSDEGILLVLVEGYFLKSLAVPISGMPTKYFEFKKLSNSLNIIV